MIEGQKIYSAHCSTCHGVDGEGTNRIAPSFASSSAVRAPDSINLVNAVLNGRQSLATDQKPTASTMPSFSRVLSDNEIASVVTYIRNSFGNQADMVTDQNVLDLRKAMQNN